MKTLTYTAPNYKYDTTLNTQSNIQKIVQSINFDVIQSDHMINLKQILYQGADLDVYASYIKSILNRNDKTLNLILLDVWNQLGPNVLKLPVFIHEKCIKVYPLIFEKTILSAISQWQIDELIILSAKSSLVFQMCSSIFNELLIKLNFTIKFYTFITHFVNSVGSQCENNSIDIIDLYPIKCRNILTLRAVKNKNSTLVTKKYFNEEFKQFILSHPKESICLLIHFPDLYEEI